MNPNNRDLLLMGWLCLALVVLTAWAVVTTLAAP